MSQRTMEAHYRPNWRLTRAHGLAAYNCGYAEPARAGRFDECQQDLVWRLLGDTPIGPDTTVLDVGSGIGGPAAWMYDRYKPGRIIGVEYLAFSARAAEQQWNGEPRRPVFVQGDAHKLPVADDSVDVLFNLESALHYADKDAFLDECRRVLKPTGTLCLGDITTTRKRLFAPLTLLNGLPSQFNTNIYLWSCEDYKAAFERHGFELAHHEDASAPIARSLAGGLDEVKQRGWRASKGFRGRTALLALIEHLLRKHHLAYDLFRATPRA